MAVKPDFAVPAFLQEAAAGRATQAEPAQAAGTAGEGATNSLGDQPAPTADPPWHVLQPQPFGHPATAHAAISSAARAPFRCASRTATTADTAAAAAVTPSCTPSNHDVAVSSTAATIPTAL